METEQNNQSNEEILGKAKGLLSADGIERMIEIEVIKIKLMKENPKCENSADSITQEIQVMIFVHCFFFGYLQLC